jgi:hypothetical protein
MSVIEKIRTALTPGVAAKLRASEARQADLEGQVAALALDEILGAPGVTAKRERLEKELVTVRADTTRLRAAVSQAEVRDERAEVDAKVAELEGQLAGFEAAVRARAEAAADLDKGAELLVKAWGRLIAANDAVRLGLPRGCSFPPGAVVGQELAAMASGAVYRHTAFTDIGDTGGVFPGAKAPNLQTQFNPSAIPSAAEIITTENGWLLRAVRGQVATARRYWRGEPQQEIEQ